MKILFIHQFFTTDKEAGEVRHIKTIRHIAPLGCSFYIIGGALNYLTGKLFKGFKGLWQKIDLGVDDIEFYRVWVSPTYQKGFLGRIFCYFTFLINSCAASVKVKKPDLVLTTSPSLFTALAGFMISKFKKVPYILEIRDLWPKVAVEMGMLRNKFIINQAYKLEKFLCRKAERIIVISKGYADYIASLGIDKSKIYIIPNGVDEDCFGFQGESVISRGIKNSNDKFKIVYAGAIGQFNYIEKLVEVADVLKKEEDSIFYVIGDGSRRIKLENSAKEKRIENIKFLGSMPKEEVKKYLTAADLTIVFYPFIDTGRLLLQNKILDYLACGKSVIYVGPEGETSRLIQEARCGWIVEDDPQKIAKQITWCRENAGRIKEMGEAGRDFVIKNYNRKKLSQEYLEILLGAA